MGRLLTPKPYAGRFQDLNFRMSVRLSHPFGKRLSRARFRADVLVPRGARLRIVPALQRELIAVRCPEPPVIALSL